MLFKPYATVTAAEYEAFMKDCSSFPEQIFRMNTMYKLPINGTPTLSSKLLARTDDNKPEKPSARLRNFLVVLGKEIAEGNDILAEIEAYENCLLSPEEDSETKVKILTDLADWFSDINVYSTSEAMKFGIDLETVQSIVMNSNFSKLGEDGKPIVDGNGKVQKGPNFRPPEAFISYYIKSTKA